jgi:hypothetical protein
MSDLGYIPNVNLTALESSPVSWGGGAAANLLGTSANALGSDSAASVNKGLTTPPETAPKDNYGSKSFLALVLDYSFASKEIKAKADTELSSRWNVVLWSALLVVIALFLFSRGLGMIGEEGEGIVVDMASPVKYPGIGHAVQGMKRYRNRGFPERNK